jgi:hypothetical protein
MFDQDYELMFNETCQLYKVGDSKVLEIRGKILWVANTFKYFSSAGKKGIKWINETDFYHCTLDYRLIKS